MRAAHYELPGAPPLRGCLLCPPLYLQFTFEDNKDVLDLIEGRRPDGLLPILDDQIRVRNGNDSTFYKNICDTHAANPKFKRIRKPTTDTAFGACSARQQCCLLACWLAGWLACLFGFLCHAGAGIPAARAFPLARRCPLTPFPPPSTRAACLHTHQCPAARWSPCLVLAAIEHYAGLVYYDAKTFVDKNKDVLLLDLQELWESSTLDLMKRIYSDESTVVSPSSKASGTQSQALHFRIQV